MNEKMKSSLKIIIVSGLPVSGKSTLAEKLSRELELPIFSVDPIESSIIKSGIKQSFETGLAAYLIAETLAAEQLKLGMSVIIDAVSPVKEARDMWHNLSDKFKAKLIIIEVVCSDIEIHKNRVQTRIRNIHGIPEVTWQDVETRRKEYLKWEEPRLVIDTSKDSKDDLNMALKYIRSNMLDEV